MTKKFSVSANLAGRIARVPAPVIFLAGGISQYLGAAVAVELFVVLAPSGVAWLRLLCAALVLVAWRRPRAGAWRGRRLVLASALGVVTGLMNAAFYEAIARLPLGTAVAIEFCGPVAVAVFLSRSARDWAALVLAGIGVLVIADVHWAGSAYGVLWALAAAAAWAGYIVLAKWVAQTGDGVDALAVGFLVGAVLLAPLALLMLDPASGSSVLMLDPASGSSAGTGPALGSARLLALGLGVGALSSVLPYALDQLVLRRVGRARFAVLLALLPVTATVVGLLTLGQIPGFVEAAGIAAVVAAVALRSRDGDEHPDGGPDGGVDPGVAPAS